jgi:hypothetical protein
MQKESRHTEKILNSGNAIKGSRNFCIAFLTLPSEPFSFLTQSSNIIGSSKKPAISDYIERETKQISNWQMIQQVFSAGNDVPYVDPRLEDRKGLKATTVLRLKNTHEEKSSIVTSHKVRMAECCYSLQQIVLQGILL